MSDLRSSRRFTCYAKAHVGGVSGIIRNMSDDGFKLLSTTTLSVGDGKSAVFELEPEKELGIGQIKIEARQQWHCFTGDFCYGFHIMKFLDSESESHFERLRTVYSKAKE